MMMMMMMMMMIIIIIITTIITRSSAMAQGRETRYISIFMLCFMRYGS